MTPQETHCHWQQEEESEIRDINLPKVTQLASDRLISEVRQPSARASLAPNYET